MDTAPRDDHSPVRGYFIGWAGLLIYILSSLIPFFRVHPDGIDRSVSLVRELTNGGSAFGPLLLLYGPAVAVGGITSVALSRRTDRDLGAVFMAATFVWALGAAGLLLATGDSIGQNISHAIGFYGMWIGVATSVTGAVVAAAKARSIAPRADTASV